jgi:hypothetical protein
MSKPYQIIPTGSNDRFMAAAIESRCIAVLPFSASRRFTCDTFDLHLHIYQRKMLAGFTRTKTTFDSPNFNPVLRQHAQALFLLTKDGKESMSIRDVTFEELLAMLRRSPKLVAKKRPLKIPTVIKLATPIFANSQRPHVAN